MSILARSLRSAFPDKTIVCGAISTIEYEKLIPEFADIVVLDEGETPAVALDYCPLQRK